MPPMRPLLHRAPLLLLASACLFLATPYLARADASAPPPASEDHPKAAFVLLSTDIRDGATLPDAQVHSDYGFHGGNLSPELHWTGAPAGTKSFAVTVFDPDAPGAGWWHWLVVNIPVTAAALSRGASLHPDKLPAGTLETRTDFGAPGYGGAAPPPGKVHHYIFTLYALDTANLDLTPDTPPTEVAAKLQSHTLATSRLTATYGH